MPLSSGFYDSAEQPYLTPPNPGPGELTRPDYFKLLNAANGEGSSIFFAHPIRLINFVTTDRARYRGYAAAPSRRSNDRHCLNRGHRFEFQLFGIRIEVVHKSTRTVDLSVCS